MDLKTSVMVQIRDDGNLNEEVTMFEYGYLELQQLFCNEEVINMRIKTKNYYSAIKKNEILERCHFCSGPIYSSHGMMFVRNDCKVFRFCKSKCHKNFKKKQNPRKFRWTKAFRKAAGKELTVDNLFEFEKRRNEPVKYQRELWNKTTVAMKRVEEIKQKRQAKFITNGLKKNKELEKVQDIKEVKQNTHLIWDPPAGKEKHLEEKMVQKLQQDVDMEDVFLKISLTPSISTFENLLRRLRTSKSSIYILSKVTQMKEDHSPSALRPEVELDALPAAGGSQLQALPPMFALPSSA
ncbi:probable ribosome biogenesis protein RLP24 [Enhydra lutris kenyoni]|uniref:Probable ribosome biogenesis protein RLP24 n=1 Tax=Enhydra lutris kenyoni TaxID=391180 RepID=A0A2Y9K049_ENHLU|nr:probable ribosome biogenesis protein RLP24 [Enhydra lutris kenyoni]